MPGRIRKSSAKAAIMMALVAGAVSNASAAARHPPGGYSASTRHHRIMPAEMIRGGAQSSSNETADEDSGVASSPLVDEQPDDNEGRVEVVVIQKIDEERAISIQLAKEKATEMRQRGKLQHDEGQLPEAAATFFQASQLLWPYCCNSDAATTDSTVLEDYATCRLHEALCRFKLDDHEACQSACTDVLVILDEHEQSQDSTTGHYSSTPIRARALYRRARAKLSLDDIDGALEDARSAAFLGDRKAVALYGTLMRRDMPSNIEVEDGGDGSTQSALLKELLQGQATGSSSLSEPMPALLSSLLNKSTPMSSSSSSGSGIPSSNPFADMLMSGLGGGNKNSNNPSGGSLAKSVLQSLTKRLEREDTQTMICNYLQNTNQAQLQQLAGMAGLPLTSDVASKLVDYAHKVTPRGIKRSVSTTKIVVYVISLLRKVMQLFAKYRQVVILYFLFVWIKSALLRPMPINKRALRAARRQGLKQ